MRYCNSDCAGYARGPYWCPGRRHKSIKEDGREGLFFVVFKKFIGHSLFREVSQMPETKILCNRCFAQLNQGVNLVFFTIHCCKPILPDTFLCRRDSSSERLTAPLPSWREHRTSPTWFQLTRSSSQHLAGFVGDGSWPFKCMKGPTVSPTVSFEPSSAASCCATLVKSLCSEPSTFLFSKDDNAA